MSETVGHRLYLATPRRFDPEPFAALLARALAAAPVACVRLDLDQAAEEDWVRAANFLLQVCHEADVALVIAEHVRLVDALGLDGVHLGASRTPVRDARRKLGPDRIVGAYVGASSHVGMAVAEAGADYVSFGPVGDTGFLGDDARADADLFEWWAEIIETPIVAEGGVAPEDAARLSDHVDFIVPDIRFWEEKDPAARLAAYADALT